MRRECSVVQRRIGGFAGGAKAGMLAARKESAMSSILRLACLLALLSVSAWAQPMRVLESSPSARGVMSGNREEFFVRFSEPVNHNTSRLIILRDGQELRQLRPRLNSSPETLYAVAGNLAPGEYVLRWIARSSRDGSTTEGMIDFTIR